MQRMFARDKGQWLRHVLLHRGTYGALLLFGLFMMGLGWRLGRLWMQAEGGMPPLVHLPGLLTPGWSGAIWSFFRWTFVLAAFFFAGGFRWLLPVYPLVMGLRCFCAAMTSAYLIKWGIRGTFFLVLGVWPATIVMLALTMLAAVVSLDARRAGGVANATGMQTCFARLMGILLCAVAVVVFEALATPLIAGMLRVAVG